MLKLEFLKQLLIISIALSTITCAFIQKTKSLFNKSKYLCIYSLLLNISASIIFCKTFTDIDLPISLWVGLFSFLGADTIYKSLEGRLASFSDLVDNNTVKISKDNIINTESDT